jgi:hypothetical protein
MMYVMISVGYVIMYVMVCDGVWDDVCDRM